MGYALERLLINVIDLYIFVVFASFIMSWLIAFDVVNTRSQAVWSIRRVLDALTEPAYRPIRRFVPLIGGLDFSPMIVLIGLYFIRDLVIGLFSRSAAYG
ncbi:MAG TPA: YggT family protein [Methylocystis sp.]|nr:YggT family protein [Methylocystis sp.]